MNGATPRVNAAAHLEGLTLDGGWKVVSRLPREAGATGGRFSVGYIIENDKGQKAFLKALDFSEAHKAPDPARMLQAMTEAFNFERDTLALCRGRRMHRVATALAEGSVTVPGGDYAVQYLIFELATGDIRAQQKAAHAIDLAWKLRALHHMAVGLDELHRSGVAHQDVKPSNVLVYAESDTRISDLGRADVRGQSCPHSKHAIPGDHAYAPPELLYQEVSMDWGCRRLGCDIYLFGSMIVFMFVGVQVTAGWTHYLDPAHRWQLCAGRYRMALPYVRDAFGKAVEDIRKMIPAAIQDQLTTAIRELCDPDPQLRGHPLNRNSDQYSLERYVSLFDLLAKKAEYGLLKF
jgi:serine/threonine protein kinase